MAIINPPGRASARDLDDHDRIDPRLPLDQRLLDVMPGQSHCRRVDRLEDERVQPGAEVGPHHALARRRAEDDPDRLTDVVLVRHDGDVASRIDGERMPTRFQRKVVTR